MGNSACCQDDRMGKMELGEIAIAQPVSTTIENFLLSHPQINEILSQNSQLEQKLIPSKKAAMREYREHILQDGVFIGRKPEDDKRKGYGIMLYADGHYYEGEWEEDKRHGNGILAGDDGAYYYGEWRRGQAEGSGVHFTKSPRTLYKGQWKSGLKNGKGVQEHEDGSIYSGDYVDGVKSGKGKLTYSNGTEYEGQFVNNVIEGTGTFRGKNHTYEGEWKSGKMHGAGKSQWKNAKNQIIAKYIGEYKDGIKEGFGEYTDSKGVTYKAIWTDGQINEKGPVVTENTRDSFHPRQSVM